MRQFNEKDQKKNCFVRDPTHKHVLSCYFKLLIEKQIHKNRIRARRKLRVYDNGFSILALINQQTQ